MLNLKAFENAEMREAPFRWGTVAPGFDSTHTALAVVRDFPSEYLRLREAGPTSEKAYRMLSAPLVEQSRILPLVHRLAPVWRQLIEELLTPRFTASVCHAAGMRLPAASLEIRASSYADGCFLGPHTDRPDKLLSLIVYLESAWSPSEGGELSILGSDDPADEVARVEPRLGTAAVLVRSDCSWHQVLPVRRPRSGYRRSLLLHYWA